MNTHETLVNYLRGVADGRELMNSIQLEKVTGWSKKAQHDRRKKGTFPFPYQSNGRLFSYSIYDVANFLLNGPQNAPNQTVAAQASTLKPVAKGSRSNNNVDDFSHLFTFTTLLDKITNEAKLLVNLRDSLEVHQREQREKELIKEISKTPKNEVAKKEKRKV